MGSCQGSFDSLFASNVRAPSFLVAAFAPAMAARGTGSIINIGSMSGSLGLPGGSYSWFVSGQAILVWHLLRRGMDRRQFWTCWFAIMAVDVVLETPGHGRRDRQRGHCPPVWATLNTNLGMAATYPAAILTFGFGAMLVWVIALGLPTVAPADNQASNKRLRESSSASRRAMAPAGPSVV